jgi:high-affinity nickel-transport protein
VDRVLGNAHRTKTRARLVAVYAVIAALNAGAWIALIAAARHYPLLLALGVTAYVLGLRHAVDPDHIAAIDSTTRKLMHLGQRPVAVGFFFSLGHSTIVLALSAVVVLFGSAIKAHLPALQSTGSVLGSTVSALFLLALAAANVAILVDVLRGSPYKEDEFNAAGGLLARVLRPALRLVTQSWHMYPLGILFGLGFDTATEIALLGISAASAAGGMPIAYIMLLPWLFVAGMSLIDTSEGVAMLAAYGWAYVKPAGKMLYNVNMTLLSIVVSLLIGGAEALALTGMPMNWISFGTVGYGIIGVFGLNLGASALVYRFGLGKYAFQRRPTD